jgi:hypothetical protein
VPGKKIKERKSRGFSTNKLLTIPAGEYKAFQCKIIFRLLSP